jgi:Flp pilus assembly protein TadG
MSKTNNQQTKQMQTATASGENHSQRGQALVEFALVLMFVILPFTFVLVDGAIMLFTYAEVTNAAREAARAAAIYQCLAPDCVIDPTDTLANQLATVDTARLQYVDSYFNSEDTRWLNALIGYSQCTRSITYPDPAYDSNTNVYNVYRQMDSLVLTLACPRRLLFGLVNTGQITLTASSTMRIEPGGVAP